MPVLPLVGSTKSGLAGRDDALLFQRLDHRDADAVLHAGERIEEFQLEQDVGLGARFLGHARQAHQRRVADGFGDGVVDAAAARVLRFAMVSSVLW